MSSLEHQIHCGLGAPDVFQHRGSSLRNEYADCRTGIHITVFFIGIKGDRTAVSVDSMLPSTSRPPVAGLSSALVLLVFAGGSILDAILRAIYHYSPAPGQLPVLLLRNLGMKLVNSSSLIKRKMIARALGLRSLA